MALDEVDEGPHPIARGSAHLVVPDGTGDIHVSPRRLLDELLEEERRGDGAARRPVAQVLEVRDGGFDLLGVFWRERHAPQRLASRLK